MVSWRSLTQTISGADAYVSCARAALSELGAAVAECNAHPTGDEDAACWQAGFQLHEERLAACRR